MRFKEKKTDLLYDAQLFQDGVLVRPAPPFEGEVELMTVADFEERFDEFYGRPPYVVAS